MARFLTQAVLLRSYDFGESDRIVHLLTRDSGRISAIAKGARRSVKRFPGTLDLFNHLHVQIDRGRRGGMARLEQASLLSPFLPLRRHPGRFGLGCYLIEVLDRMAPEGGVQADARRLFEFCISVLEALQRVVPDARLRVLLELRALAALGLCPELRHCVRCGGMPQGSERVGFHIAEGGAVCSACAGDVQGLLRIHLGTLRVLEQSLHFDLARLDRLALGRSSLAEASRLVERFQRFHVGIDLKSVRFLDEIMGGGARHLSLTAKQAQRNTSAPQDGTKMQIPQ